MAQTFGRLSDWFLFGPLSGVELLDLAPRDLPGPRWVRVEPIASGICGSDISMLTFHSGTALEPFTSFPAVPGHETLARVVEVGKEIERVKVGDRVVIDPMLSCEARGFDDPCPSCAIGAAGTCTRLAEQGKTVGRGMFTGLHAELPGGWGSQMLCHESQLFVVPDALADETAVLCEPLSVGMHAVLQTPLDSSAALVIGSGPIALGTIWALRAAGFEGTILAQTKRKYEADLAKKLGATATVGPSEARAALLETGAKAYKPMIGEEVFAGGGFPLVFDCVGSEDSLTQAMRFAAPRARLVVLGCAAELRRLDLTFLWARELTMQGFIGYGRERTHEHTFAVTLRRLVETKAPIAEMVTHRFPLQRYREALSAGANRAKSGAIKILFTPA